MGLSRQIKKSLRFLGIDVKVWKSYRFLPLYVSQRKQWLAQNGVITHRNMILHDYEDKAGVAAGHYFHQDLLVATFVHDRKPERHIDVGSRIDGFVAHVAAFREVEVFDVRPLLPTAHKNIIFKTADLMQDCGEEITDSLSCLHAIEHFGLGRYTDPVDVNGHLKGITNLIRMLKPSGILYISFPIGKSDEVHFNAHRVFHPKSILSYPSVRDQMALERFDFVDDKGELHLDQTIDSIEGKTRYGCGIYTFRKVA